MLLPSLALLGGLIALVWSADKFVAGSAAAAKHLGMSPVMIGLTIVALGTSAPEILVSAEAALNGAPGLGIGNAIGSNIANIGLVLGITAMFATIPIAECLLRRELPLLLIVTAACGAALWDHYLSFIEGLLLFSATFVIIGGLVFGARRRAKQVARGELAAIAQDTASATADNPCVDDFDRTHELAADVPEMSTRRSWVYLTVGLLILLASADLLVWSATEMATYFGVKPLIIGLTVVALGTSLPELAASVTSALKGHHDIAVGNIMGSNILNILAVMSLPGLIAPTDLTIAVLHRDYSAMVWLTLLLTFVICLQIYRRHRHRGEEAFSGGISKGWGFLFLCGYAAYYVSIFATAQH